MRRFGVISEILAPRLGLIPFVPLLSVLIIFPSCRCFVPKMPTRDAKNCSREIISNVRSQTRLEMQLQNSGALSREPRKLAESCAAKQLPLADKGHWSSIALWHNFSFKEG
jgi:hypothetical protein